MAPKNLDPRSLAILPQYLWKKSTASINSYDGFIIRLHYIYMFAVLMLGGSIPYYSWFTERNISCVSQYNAMEPVSQDDKATFHCMNYPKVTTKDGSVEQVLWYKWIDYVLIISALLVYVTRKVSKILDNTSLSHIRKESSFKRNGDLSQEYLQTNQAVRDAIEDRGLHNTYYFKYLGCILFCLIVNGSIFFTLDFIMKNNFKYLVPSVFPIERDFGKFSDSLSQSFPAFVNCTIDQQSGLMNLRTEHYTCHLPNMEIYDKYFVLLWVCMVLCAILTVATIIYYALFLIPCLRPLLLKVPKPASVDDTRYAKSEQTLKKMKVGDVFVLYQLRDWFSNAQFHVFLNQFTKEDCDDSIPTSISIGPKYCK